jgi:epoxyqueuosine reductase
MQSSLTESIRSYALSLGFSRMGIASARALEQDEQALVRWLEKGCHGDMAYMAREPRRRARPQAVLPGAQSVIVLAMNYWQEEPTDFCRGTARRAPTMGRVSRYAWGRDYHTVIEERLSQLETFIKMQAGPDVNCKSYVDHGPVLEKAMAREAGMGFIGKNTLLITEEYGSYVFLSVILTTLRLEPGRSQTSQCGSCRNCLDACPTGALTAPFVLDARRCISYLTIENKGEIPDDLQPLMGDRVFGCDICQEVCPYNAKPAPTHVKEFFSDQGAGPWLNLTDLLRLNTDEAFQERFAGTPLLRSKRSGLARNAQSVIKNRKIDEGGLS